MTRTAPPDQIEFPARLALLVAGAFFIQILDSTIIAPAAPQMAADFGVAPVDVNLAITVYVFTVGVLIPISGWLSDRFGPRRVFCLALAVFTLASVLCALAPHHLALAAARVLQGAGGAMMVPVGRLAVLKATGKPDLVRAIAYLTWPALLAPVIAPVLGGALAQYASWRWIFLINVPLGLGALLIAVRLVPDLRPDTVSRLDWRGFAFTAVGVGLLLISLEQLGHGAGPGAVIMLASAAVVLALAVRHFHRCEEPLLDLRVLRVRTYRLAAASGSVYRAVIITVPFLLPLLFQVGLGWSPALSGAVVIALFVGNVAIKPATTPLMRRFGIRAVLFCSIAVGMGCLAGMAFLTATTPIALVLILLVVSGIVRSIGFTAYNSAAFADVAPQRINHANTLLATLQELGAGFGIAMGALLVRLGQELPYVPEGAGPYRLTFAIFAAVMVLPAVAALRLSSTAGDEVTGRT
ncbi:MFS transporter [Rhodococcus sp. WS4]|nr:MFS transporter [Rhodococcus sp. WS4]